MRRLLFACALAALVLPAAAAALSRVPGDGTLSVKNANGVVQIAARGGVIGICDEQCKVTIVDPQPEDGVPPIVTGEDRATDLSETKVLYEGDGVRFRIIGGRFRLRASGIGIDLSAVGFGSVTLRGWSSNLGTYSFNGGPRRLLPDEAKTFQLAEPPPPPLG